MYYLCELDKRLTDDEIFYINIHPMAMHAKNTAEVSKPKPLSPWEGLCMLCWLCIVQSLWAYTPGIRAGAECGATAPRPRRGR